VNPNGTTRCGCEQSRCPMTPHLGPVRDFYSFHPGLARVLRPGPEPTAAGPSRRRRMSLFRISCPGPAVCDIVIPVCRVRSLTQAVGSTAAPGGRGLLVDVQPRVTMTCISIIDPAARRSSFVGCAKVGAAMAQRKAAADQLSQEGRKEGRKEGSREGRKAGSRLPLPTCPSCPQALPAPHPPVRSSRQITHFIN
jgi:hypothetical protein